MAKQKSSSFNNTGKNASRQVKQAATGKWSMLFARIGYAAKGLVYIIIGGLAAKAATGSGGSVTDRKGALEAIYNEPFGKFLLGIVAIGLLGFAWWNLIRAIVDPDHEGTKLRGTVMRIGYAIAGLSYAALAWATFQVVRGSGNIGKSSDQATQDWTSRLLNEPLGTLLVIVLGLIVLAVGLSRFYTAYQGKFLAKLDLSTLRAKMKKWVGYLGRSGLVARGIVFAIIGGFLVLAALKHNAAEAVGLSGALNKVAAEPYGRFLLTVVALGLVTDGIFSLFEAYYRRLGTGR